MKVYVDDLLVKIGTPEQHLDYLRETFAILRQSGKFLGFTVLERGIEANLEKVEVIHNMAPPRSIIEVQRLAGRVREVGLLHQYHGAEAKYPRIEQLGFMLVLTKHKLCLYFQAHPIRVFIETPLKKILQRPDASGRLMNWEAELSEFDIDYAPWNTIQEHALADFVAEFTGFPAESEYAPPMKPWQVFVMARLVGLEGEWGCISLRLRERNTITPSSWRSRPRTRGGAFRTGGSQKIKKRRSWHARHPNKKTPPTRANDDPNHRSTLRSYRGDGDITRASDWARDILKYLDANEVLDDRQEARKIRNRAARYTLIEGILYRRGHSNPLLRCISSE
ncbi:hypothetical protein F2P56_035417 [Juglans regia]|uniref:Reverse transcriptase domain-containing protein n=1 Tax=Juglans regia TaxID=51240 RepID=A0A833X658_JUGRE|nr:hypothetical protein F2P56_035417 [Juglans regia]